MPGGNWIRVTIMGSLSRVLCLVAGCITNPTKARRWSREETMSAAGRR
jgi:hypothetical protein